MVQACLSMEPDRLESSKEGLDNIMTDVPERERERAIDLALPTSVVRAYPTSRLFIGDFYAPLHSGSPTYSHPAGELQTINPQLQLIKDLTDATDGPTSLSIISAADDDSSNQNPAARVRFRSRVRITSGINHHRHRLSTSGESEGLRSSRSSSLSGSSSISAPLRSHADEEVVNPGWGTLGQRVSLFAKGKGPTKRQRLRNQREQPFHLPKSERRRRNRPRSYSEPIGDERTPLNRSSYRQLYVQSNSSSQDLTDEEEFDYQKEVELVFGPWPLRLLNHHWWWWKIEPVFCCRHTADSDEEG